jgi:histidine triad (HIT) family protein
MSLPRVKSLPPPDPTGKMPLSKRSDEGQKMATPDYDPNNIFAKILRGELPAHKVYENDKAFAFLDIMPRAPGHTLVIPKAPARNILDIATDELAELIKATQTITRAAMKAFAADGITIQQFNEPAGGQVVFHLHVHVIPRKIGVALKPPASFKEDPAILSDQALKLAAALKGA